MKKRAILRVLGYARRYWLYLAGAVGGAVASVALTLLAPVIIGAGVDLILGPGQVDFQGLARIIGLLALVILGSALFQWLMGLCTNAVAYRTVRDLRVDIFCKLERVPLKVIDNRPHGDLISRVINDIDVISDGLLQGFSQLFSGVVTILGTLAFMLSVNWLITVAVVVITPLSLFVAYFIAKGCHNMFTMQAKKRGELSGLITEMLSNQRVVKLFGYEKRARERFEVINGDLKVWGQNAAFYSALVNPCTRFVNNVVYVAVCILGAYLVIKGEGVLGMSAFTVGGLSCFLTYANQYTKPFNEITGVVTELQTATAAAARVFELLSAPDQPSDKGFDELENVKGNVEIDNVYFSYVKTNPLIQGFSLKVKSGQRIAIVGPTGCGKTTLINLLMRFYDADSGEIRVDGTPVNKVTRKSLRLSYGMVLQDTWLKSGTIRDNISYGHPEASEVEIIRAARQAHAHGFIMRMPDGYDTVISEDGGNLSQGQKQLLCIARVMLCLPPMLILDEATSSIDTRTEIKVQKAFAQMMEGRTSFIVAHRLSTIREADVILVMRDGKIVEKGKHEELLGMHGFYADIYNAQFARG